MPVPVHLLPVPLYVPGGEAALVGEFQRATGLGEGFAELRVHELVDIELHRASRVSGHVDDPGVHPADTLPEKRPA